MAQPDNSELLSRIYGKPKNLKIKIIKSNNYDIATRNIKEGDTYKVDWIGESWNIKKGTCYLFLSKNKKVSLAYQNEVILL